MIKSNPDGVFTFDRAGNPTDNSLSRHGCLPSDALRARADQFCARAEANPQTGKRGVNTFEVSQYCRVPSGYGYGYGYGYKAPQLKASPQSGSIK